MADEPTDTSPHTLDEQTLIDNRYRVLSFLGQGGFAEVYRARHIHIDRLVALKLLIVPKRLRDDERFMERFRQEAMVAARVEHPGVVHIHDFGFYGDEGYPYIAMELLEGRDLSQLLREEGRLAPLRAVRLMQGALEALAEAHEQDIVHKDLKPSNLFVTTIGTDAEMLKLVDFGIARMLSDDKKLTTTGNMAGTPQYLAPEYINDGLVLPGTDVYQMGLILIEMMSGVPAVQGPTSVACLMKHVQGSLEVPNALRQSSLGPIIDEATALSPDRRYPSAREFAEALARVSDDELETLVIKTRVATEPEISGLAPTADSIPQVQQPPVPTASNLQVGREVAVADTLDAPRASLLAQRETSGAVGVTPKDERDGAVVPEAETSLGTIIPPKRPWVLPGVIVVVVVGAIAAAIAFGDWGPTADSEPTESDASPVVETTDGTATVGTATTNMVATTPDADTDDDVAEVTGDLPDADSQGGADDGEADAPAATVGTTPELSPKTPNTRTNGRAPRTKPDTPTKTTPPVTPDRPKPEDNTPDPPDGGDSPTRPAVTAETKDAGTRTIRRRDGGFSGMKE